MAGNWVRVTEPWLRRQRCGFKPGSHDFRCSTMGLQRPLKGQRRSRDGLALVRWVRHFHPSLNSAAPPGNWKMRHGLSKSLSERTGWAPPKLNAVVVARPSPSKLIQLVPALPAQANWEGAMAGAKRQPPHILAPWESKFATPGAV